MEINKINYLEHPFSVPKKTIYKISKDEAYSILTKDGVYYLILADSKYSAIVGFNKLFPGELIDNVDKLINYCSIIYSNKL